MNVVGVGGFCGTLLFLSPSQRGLKGEFSWCVTRHKIVNREEIISKISFSQYDRSRNDKLTTRKTIPTQFSQLLVGRKLKKKGVKHICLGNIKSIKSF